jgi:hypothetical protein
MTSKRMTATKFSIVASPTREEKIETRKGPPESFEEWLHSFFLN